MPQYPVNAVKLAETSPLLQLHKTSPDLYERFVLAAYNGDPDFYAKTQSILCIDEKKAVYRSDFTVPAYFKLFLCIVQHRHDNAELGGVPTPVGEQEMCLTLQAFAAARPDVISEGEVQDLLALWRDITRMVHMSLALSVLNATFEIWLLGRRSAMEAADFQRGILTSEDLVQNLQDQAMRVSSVQQNMSSDFGDDLFDDEPTVERLPLGSKFTMLDRCTGGGFGKTELALFIAPTGGGKTVLATQLATRMAMNRNQVLFLSTEQNHRELQPRIISAQLQIDFDRVKDGGNLRNILRPEEQTKAKTLIATLRPYLHFEVWGKGSGMTVEADLDRVCAKYIAKHGKIDCLILDWIGGALSETASPDMVRFVYQRAAVKLKALATKYNLAAIAFAQSVSAVDAVRQITEKHIAECKGLHRTAEVCIGISCLKSRPTDDAEGSQIGNTYADTQWFNTIKTRKSTALCWSVKRNFQYQRFDEIA